MTSVSQKRMSNRSPSTLPTLERTKLFLWTVLLFPFLIAGQSAEAPVVQAVLFYSPTCPHCQQVINELLIPMQDQYGDQLQIIGIDTSQQAGGELYQKAIESFKIPAGRRGVPTLIVGDTILVGSVEVPDRFPRLVEAGLSAGGIGWPDIPDLAVAIPDLPPPAGPNEKSDTLLQATAVADSSTQDQLPVSEPTAVAIKESVGEPGKAQQPVQTAQMLENVNEEPTVSESGIPASDPVGFILAWIVLLGMSGSLLYTLRQIWICRRSLGLARISAASFDLSWAVPALAMVGLGVALYLSYVEVNQVEAICGPIGECNIVQASPYARLLGVPIAVLGLLSYLAIVVLWFGQRILHNHLQAISALLLLGITVFGTGFSAYLTVLELFVIKAVCAWCLTSAVITTLIMILMVKGEVTRPSTIRLEVQS